MVDTRHGPLAGVRIVEFDSPHAAPFAGMVLADLGCDIVRVRRQNPDGGAIVPVLYRGRSEILLDLNTPAGQRGALSLIARADAVIEGFGPGEAEALGIGPEPCLERNPRLVYGRMTGWGATGPMADDPGNDINYLAIAGALHGIGPAGGPVPPLSLVGEFAGGGLFMALGLVSALLATQARGHGQVVESAQVDGAASLMTLYYALHSAGRWADRRAENLTDGGAPFYRCYACSDKRHVAVGALEAGEFEALCLGLGLKPHRYPQYDRRAWPDMAAAFAGVFARRPRDEWVAIFAERGVPVSPVLSLEEAPLHPHNRARGTFGAPLGPLQPMPVPRLSVTPARPVPQEASSVAEVLERWV